MSKKTQWIPLGNYEYASVDYIVFVRKNLKTGMMQFKTKKAGSLFVSTDNFLPGDLIDVKKQWDLITQK